MAEIIKYSDNVFIEIAGAPGRAEPFSNAQVTPLERSFGKAVEAVSKAIEPVVTSISSLTNTIALESVEVELGATFSVEGNAIICKSSAEGALKIKVTVKPRAANQ
jgi:hypothetical protein